MADTTCLYTTIKNTSGDTRFFGFLPPHGLNLTSTQSVTIFGDIYNYFFKQGRVNARAQASFESEYLAGNLEIIRSPAVFVYDDTTTYVKFLDADNGSVILTNPCPGSYTGSP